MLNLLLRRGERDPPELPHLQLGPQPQLAPQEDILFLLRIVENVFKENSGIGKNTDLG